MFRHLPPTATPLPLRTLLAAWAPNDDAVPRLCRTLADLIGAPACFAASSGRTALHLLLAGLAAHRPERTCVILPAYTCPSLLKVLLETDLTPILVDLSPTDFTYHPDALAAALDGSTLAVVLVHPFGIPLPLEPVRTLTHAAGAYLIEDAAQSMGAATGSHAVGSQGDFGLFSLGPGKPLSAGGGGLLTVNRTEHVGLVQEAWTRLPPARRRDDLAALARLALFTTAFQPGGWWLAAKAGAQRAGDDEANWGFALTGLSNSQATVALAQLPRLARYNAQRRANAEQLLAGLAGLPGVTLPSPTRRTPDTEPIYLRLPLVWEDPTGCAAVHRALLAHGIGAGRMYKRTLAELFRLPGGPYPGAQQLAQCLLTLPTHHHLTPRDIERTVAIVRDA